jgi:hypothetical protein
MTMAARTEPGPGDFFVWAEVWFCSEDAASFLEVVSGESADDGGAFAAITST